MTALPETLDDGGIYAFYGVDHNQFKLNDIVYEAVEDESDGYRSYLESVEVRDSKGIFFGEPLDKVVLVEVDKGDFSGFELRSTTDENHVWLRFGTDNYDDYYPCFVFRYEPKEGP